MVGGTIAEAARTLVKTMLNNYRRRPFYYSESNSKSRFSLIVQDLIKAMISIPPSTKFQKAITPAFFAQYTSSGLKNSADDHKVDLIIRAFFFAMCSCKYSIPKELERTITDCLGRVKIFDIQRKEINQNHPHLLQIAIHGRLLFEGKKIGEKYETRNHRRSRDVILCLILRICRAVKRVLNITKNPNQDTPLYAVNILGRRSRLINQENTLVFVRVIYETFGGRSGFGFHPNEIRNRSVRSGAVMALFLTDCSSNKNYVIWKIEIPGIPCLL